MSPTNKSSVPYSKRPVAAPQKTSQNVVIRLILAFWRFSTGVAFPAIVAFVGAFTGLWVSVYSTELKNAFAEIAKNRSFSLVTEAHVLIAAVLFVFFFLIFATQQHMQTRASARAQSELIQETNTLRSMVTELKTLPPGDFLQSFQESFLSVQHLLLFAKPSEARDIDHVTMIQSVLRAIATLAHRYDRRPDNVKYSANVMVYWDNLTLQKMIGSDDAKALLNAVIFADVRDDHFTSGRGLLELVPSLAATADENAHSEPDQIVLPVSDTPWVNLMAGDRFNVLPGAPFALSLGRFAHYDSIETMLKWCQDEADISLKVRDQLRSYFHGGKGKDIRSFLSIPLRLSDASIGVLNVQASAPRMLDKGGTALFVPLITSLVSLLTYLVANWMIERERERTLIGPKPHVPDVPAS
ncbi:hypothetical protein [Paraburkholderia caledonica]|uniref:hypothetical protein n=1 Tax=Paraburkholderia caledonica TaxID=134536 RepID=UPI00117888D8|nr:hypothetical protein [Paraburkholderia caledonica]